MSDTSIGIAIIGTQFGCSGHLRALRLAGFDVKALVGRDANKTAELAQYYRVPIASTSVPEILARNDIHAVVIATPPSTHKDFTLQALAAGKHVLCEKPFALNIDDAREMLQAAESSGLVHRLGHEFRFDPAYLMARRMLARGDIGTPRQALFAFDFPLTVAPDPDVPAWFRERRLAGGWLHNYGTHAIDLVRYLLGEFAHISGALLPGLDHHMTSDDGYALQFSLANGLEGIMSASTRAFDMFSLTRIVGTSGTLMIDEAGISLSNHEGKKSVELDADLAPETFEVDPLKPLGTDAGMYEIIHSNDAGLGNMVRQARSFLTAIRGQSHDEIPPATFHDGFAHTQVIAAAMAAADARTGQRIDAEVR
jgi:predicted dehydrogenase